jgi:hypothetical protein
MTPLSTVLLCMPAVLALLFAIRTGFARALPIHRVPGRAVAAPDHGTAAVVFGEQATIRQEGMRTAESVGQDGMLRLERGHLDGERVGKGGSDH